LGRGVRWMDHEHLRSHAGGGMRRGPTTILDGSHRGTEKGRDGHRVAAHVLRGRADPQLHRGGPRARVRPVHGDRARAGPRAAARRPPLDRLPTGAIPTDAGRRLTPLARQVLDLENRIRTEVPADGDEPAGPEHLIAPESVCAYRLPALITRLRAEAPQVRLVLTPGGTAAALAAVRDGTTDVAVVLEPVLAVPDLDVRTVGTEAVVLLAAPAGDRARRWTWADLAERETLLLEEGCSYGDQAARHLVAAGQP